MPVLLQSFKDGYYCDEDAVKEAIRQKGMFNIIDHGSHYKADLIIVKEDSFHREEFSRRRHENFMILKVWLVSPEDLLLSKLIWIQQLKNVQQAEDIKMLVNTDDLDWHYINIWVEELRLNTFGLLKK